MSNTTQSELTAIHEAAAFAPLPDRAFLRITGSDAARWLNGMVTNSIATLAPGEGNYNFLLNAQGRIQGDGTIYRDTNPADPAGFLLATTAAQLEPIQQHLDHFIIMDDVELTPLEMTGVGIVGHAARRLAFELWDRENAKAAPETGPLGEMRRSPYRGGQQIFLYPPSLESLKSQFDRVEIWSPDPQETLATERALLDNRTAQVSNHTLEALRILEAVPRYGQDIRNSETARDLPQETAQTHALHFSKGCYLGQEIVERIHSRGQVHRTFTQFRLTPDNDSNDSQNPPALPVALQSNGKPAGELTSAALIPGRGLLALGYIRREALDLHQPLTYPGGTAAPIL